jgi:membrane-associated phospholipid phosphatase
MGPAATRRGVQTGDVAAAIGGTAMLAGSWVVVTATDEIPDVEMRVFSALNELPDALWPFVWAPVQIGSFVGSLLVVTATAVVTREPRLTASALLASQGAYWGAKAVKHLASRGRPVDEMASVRVRERATGLGYVSGHSAVAFALAAVLGSATPAAWRVVPLAVATIVGLGRVYAGVHLPLDVVGGVGLGILAGIASRWALGLGGAGVPSRRADVPIAR